MAPDNLFPQSDVPHVMPAEELCRATPIFHVSPATPGRAIQVKRKDPRVLLNGKIIFNRYNACVVSGTPRAID
jgi:hypothetical protein